MVNDVRGNLSHLRVTISEGIDSRPAQVEGPCIKWAGHRRVLIKVAAQQGEEPCAHLDRDRGHNVPCDVSTLKGEEPWVHSETGFVCDAGPLKGEEPRVENSSHPWVNEEHPTLELKRPGIEAEALFLLRKQRPACERKGTGAQGDYLVSLDEKLAPREGKGTRPHDLDAGPLDEKLTAVQEEDSAPQQDGGRYGRRYRMAFAPTPLLV